jgi:hypothetical protein
LLELERVGAGLLSLLVGGEGGDLGADAHGQIGHASSLRGERMTPQAARATLRTMRFIIRVVVNAFAIWVVTLIPRSGDGHPFAPGRPCSSC